MAFAVTVYLFRRYKRLVSYKSGKRLSQCMIFFLLPSSATFIVGWAVLAGIWGTYVSAGPAECVNAADDGKECHRLAKTLCVFCAISRYEQTIPTHRALRFFNNFYTHCSGLNAIVLGSACLGHRCLEYPAPIESGSRHQLLHMPPSSQHSSTPSSSRPSSSKI